MTSTASSLRTVAMGLGLVYAGLCLLVLAVMVALLGGFALDPQTVLVIAGLMALVAIVLDTIGRVRCLSMPDDGSGARVIVIVSVIFSLAALVMQLISLGNLFLDLGIFPQLMQLFSMPVSLVGSILFLFFLRALALYVRREDYAGRAITVLVIGGISVMGYLGLVFMALTGAAINIASGALGILALAFVVLVLGIITLIRYGNLLTYMKEAVLKYADQVPSEEDREAILRQGEGERAGARPGAADDRIAPERSPGDRITPE
jgi:hypothetical protein